MRISSSNVGFLNAYNNYKSLRQSIYRRTYTVIAMRILKALYMFLSAEFSSKYSYRIYGITLAKVLPWNPDK